MKTGEEVQSLEGHTHSVSSLAWSKNGKFLAACTAFEESIRVWDTGKGKEMVNLKLPGENVRALAFSPDGETLAAGTQRGKVFLYEVAGWKQKRVLEGENEFVVSVAFTADGKTLLSGAEVTTFWDPKSGQKKMSFRVGDVSSAAISRDGKWIVTGHRSKRDNIVRVWEMATGNCVHELKGHTFSVANVALSPDDTLLASASLDRTVRLWDLKALLEKK